MRTNEPCRQHLCGNEADTPDGLCSPCRASDRLVAAVNSALEDFLNTRWPMSTRTLQTKPDHIVRQMMADRISADERATISEAGGYVAQGLMRFIELAVGQTVWMTSGPRFDGYDGWQGGLGWDISDGQAEGIA